VEVAPVLEVSRAEEGGPELSVYEYPLRDGLGDGALPCSGQTIQPVDGRLVEVPRPELDLVQNGSASSLQTTPTASVTVLGILGTPEIVENSCFSYRSVRPSSLRTEGVLTWVLSKGYCDCFNAK